jgi:hypothetical protein
MCRKAHGASFATAVGSPIGAFRFERGADLVVRFDSSQHSVRAFCTRCRASTPTRPA